MGFRLAALLIALATCSSSSVARTAADVRAEAEQGSIEAQVGLCELYRRGSGVPKDVSEAVRWCAKAAAQGSKAGYWHLGNMLFLRNGSPKDQIEMASWVRKWADSGDAEAQVILSNAYELGEGVAKNLVEAYKWANISAAANGKYIFFSAADARKRLEKEMTREQISEGQSLSTKWSAKPLSLK